MLIIYYNLAMGGIQTFVLRLAKERHRQGLTTSIILLSRPEESDPELLNAVKSCAEVIFVSQLSRLPPRLVRCYPWLAPFSRPQLRRLLRRHRHVHITSAQGYHFATHLMRLSGVHQSISVGVYHSLEFAWNGRKVPVFEALNRQAMFTSLPKHNIFCFADFTRRFMQAEIGYQLARARAIPLGIIEQIAHGQAPSRQQPIRICAVGRLVPFKSYSLAMVDAVAELRAQGYHVIYDIFGTGPLQQAIESRIQRLALGDRVRLQGPLPYDRYDETVAGYHFFVGSGTAIIQAAAQGVPSIIGIESIADPVTYGFFADFYHTTYHHPRLGQPHRAMAQVIAECLQGTDQQWDDLCARHKAAAQNFAIRQTVQSMNQVLPVTRYQRVQQWVHALSEFLFYARLYKRIPFTVYSRRHRR